MRFLALLLAVACSAPPPPLVPVDAGSHDAGAIDSCAGARLLTTEPQLANTLTGTSTYTTECGGDGNDLLFRFTLTEPRDVMLVASPLDIGMPIVALFDAPCTPGALSTVACGNGTANAYNLPAGEHYALLDSPAGEGGPTDLILVLTAPTPPPANDRCEQAEALPLDAGVTGDTRGATDGNAATCGRNAADVVYRYTLAQPRTVTLTVTPQSGFRPVVSVTASCSGAELACAAASATGSGPARLVLPDQPAGTYFVWVDGAPAGSFTVEASDR